MGPAGMESTRMSSFQDFVMIFQKAFKGLQLYGAAHPRTQEALSGLVEGYRAFLEGKAQVQIATRNGRLFVDRVMADTQNHQTRTLASDLEEREIHALVMFPAAEAAELQALLEILCLKPARLRELGGARKVLEERNVQHIRILAARLEDVSEAGEIAAALLESVAGMAGEAGAGPGGGGGPEGGGEEAASDARNNRSGLAVLLRNFLAAAAGGGLAPADLSGLGPALEGAGLDPQGALPDTQTVLVQAVGDLEPEQQIGIFRGARQLGAAPLRGLFGRLSAAQSVATLSTAFGRGTVSPQQMAELADDLKGTSPNPSRWGEQLIEALRREGMSASQLKDLVDILTWEDLPVDEKVAKLLEDQKIFEMPRDKVLTFLRELLEAGRIQDFLKLMRQYAVGLSNPAVARRTTVAQAFEQIADWVDIPGMPVPVMDELMEILSRAYGREKYPEVHETLSRAVEHILWFWVELGNPAKAHSLFNELQDVVTEMSLPAPWKAQATAELLARLGAPERVNKVLSQLYDLDRPTAAAKIHPYLRMLGPSSACHLVDRLAEETDRMRRGRLLEALKSCGQTAETPLLESLKSSEWYVVRNALIVLSEVAGPSRLPEVLPFLAHADLRVVRAAVRCLGRFGGRAAETALIPLLNHRDPDTQMEVLFTIGEMRSKLAVPALIELIKAAKGRGRHGQERIREKAVEVLGLAGSPTAIPTLEELLARHKSFFSESREPLPVRVAALKSLRTLGTTEALHALRRVLDAEPSGADLEALQAALTAPVAQASSDSAF